jgi:hypothetical protein
MNRIREKKKDGKEFVRSGRNKVASCLINHAMQLLYTEEHKTILHSLKLHGSTSCATTKTTKPTAISISN